MGSFPKTYDLKSVVIKLERGPCYGPCPIYKLTIHGEGKVVYVGERFVQVEGKKTSLISKKKMRELVSEFEKTDYFALKNRYDREDWTCNPSTITSIEIQGRKKRIYHYHGDCSAPEALTKLEDKIDEIASTKRWGGEID